jgi:hypothetical protein
MAIPGDSAQPRESMTPEEKLEWQAELDSAMADIDSRLRHPRRRASDQGQQPTLPQLGKIDVTSELLDEIAWRVSEQIRRQAAQGGPPAPGPTGSAPSQASPRRTAPAPKPEPVQPMPSGIAITIRLRRPLFRLRFWRRRTRKPVSISFADSRLT